MKPSATLQAERFELLLTGCRMIKTITNVPGQAVRAVTPARKNKPAVDPVELQHTLDVLCATVMPTVLQFG